MIMLDGTGIGEKLILTIGWTCTLRPSKKRLSVLTDGTNEYTDSNGNIYINNY